MTMQQAADLYAEKEKDLYIVTSKGRKFYIAHPEFDVEEIAHALAMQCRYTGHVLEFYSVAQHSLLVSDLLKFEGEGQLAFEGLMHDAHEAYVSDIASPWKVLIPDYRGVEHRLETAMRKWAGLPEKISDPVKRADWLALFIEAQQLLPPGSSADWLEPEVGMKDYAAKLLYKNSRFIIQSQEPRIARNLWMSQYWWLKRLRK